MCKPALGIIALFMFVSATLIDHHAFAVNGEAIFLSMRCDSCHKSDRESLGSTLIEISRAYESSDQLVAYFNGTSAPIVNPARAAMMKGQLRKIAELSDEEKRAMADYMLTFKGK